MLGKEIESEASSLAKIVRKNLLEFPSLSKGLWWRREIVPLGGVDTLWEEDKEGEGLGPGVSVVGKTEF